jgi:hypothetical protein
LFEHGIDFGDLVGQDILEEQSGSSRDLRPVVLGKKLRMVLISFCVENDASFRFADTKRFHFSCLDEQASRSLATVLATALKRLLSLVCEGHIT